MKTRIADASGFCFGVKRAISLAEDTLTEEPLYALGPLVHNPQEMRRLEPMGLAVVSDIELVPDGAVLLIRAHGAASEVYAAAEYKRLRVIDATCPHVKKLLSKAADFVQQGYQLLIVGDANHPEVQAAQAWARGSALVITGPEEIATLPLSDRVAIVAQTTTKLHVWEAVLQELRSRVPNLEIGYTICHATKERQQAAQELSKQVDIMVVVGGHNSANTRNLVQLCSEIGTPTHHVETAADLDPSWFKPGALVGITAGASTPDWIIKEVVTTVENMENKNNEVMEESTLEKPAEEVTSAEVTAAEAENVAPCQCEEQECECESGEKTEEATNMADVAGDMINIRTGQIVEGTVVRVTESEVFVDIRYKSDGVIQINELSNLPNVQPADVLQEAQAMGYAEADPTSDVDGYDSAYKLAILSAIAFNTRIKIDDIYCEGISGISSKDIAYAAELGYVIKLLAVARPFNGQVEARVHPAMLPADHPLASVNDVFNAVWLRGDGVGDLMFYGRGAGSLPTGSAIIGDVVESARNIINGASGRISCTCFDKLDIRPISDISLKYYLRLQVADKPGVLASLAGVLGDHTVSISSVVQKSGGDMAELVIITHEVEEKNVQAAIGVLRKMNYVSEVSSLIRLEEE